LRKWNGNYTIVTLFEVILLVINYISLTLLFSLK